jgi:hypothetical protein
MNDRRRSVTRGMTRTRNALLTVATLGVLLCTAAPASAGALNAPIYISGESGCNLLGPYGTSGALSVAPCGGPTLSLQFQPAPVPLGPGFPQPLSARDGIVRRGTTVGYMIDAPPGITINSASISQGQTYGISHGEGWSAYWFRAGRIGALHGFRVANDTAVNADNGFNSRYFGIALKCDWAQCTNPAQVSLNNIRLTASEAQGPAITSIGGAGNLWNQAGRWIWNAPGNSWPLELSAQDVTGVCALTAQAGATALADSLPAPNGSSWQECAEPAWTTAVDTRDSVPTAGDLPITVDATNAGQVTTQASEALQVDNDPVSVSLSTPNDPNPTVWINHAVTVDAAAGAGPSGLGGMNCSLDGGAAQSYPAGGLTVNGDGVRTVSCTAWNNAVDPEGNHASGTSSMTLHIDEAPPSLSLEPENPNDPTGLVADTSDTESGVAGGSVEMAPAGTGSWTTLPTTFTGGELLTHFNDAGLHGPYTFRVQSCDNVGNCASIIRTLTLPVRVASISEVSIAKIPAARCTSAHVKPAASTSAARSAHQDVRDMRQIGGSAVDLTYDVGLHPRVHPVIAAGNVFATGSLGGVVLARSPRDQRPRGTMTASVRSYGAETTRSCRTPGPSLATRAKVGFGRPVTVHGLLMSGGGLPLAGQPVTVLTAPDNGSNAFTGAAAVTTDANGGWTATLPPGPSRIIEASYAGSSTTLPASGQAIVITPAKIELTRVTPDRTPWGGTVRISGRVLGGYIPASSKLLRLDLGVVGIPGLSKIQGIPSVSPDGRFTTTYMFARAYGVVRFWLNVSSLPEADFPFAPAHSPRVIVTVGVPAPRPKVTRTSHPTMRSGFSSRIGRRDFRCHLLRARSADSCPRSRLDRARQLPQGHRPRTNNARISRNARRRPRFPNHRRPATSAGRSRLAAQASEHGR